MGFAGATGLVASGLTDIASSFGPFLPWFCFFSAAATLALAFLIGRYEKQRKAEATDPANIRAYCQSFLVLIGSLFGAIVLLISGFFTDNSSGSNIISILNEIRSGVERVEEKVDVINEGVEGLGESISLRDISGRSGTGKIGDNAMFEVTLANARLMDGARCALKVSKEWQDVVTVLDDACDSFTVKLPTSPLLDSSGSSRGDIVPIPFELQVIDGNRDVIASYADSYPLHNNYRSIDIVLDPGGNRLKINEQRKIRVDVGDAELPDTVECEWTVFDPLSIQPTSDNGCEGVLSTEVDTDAYVYKRLVNEGEIRDQIYVQINSAADFSMLGNATLKFAIRP
jgi:hypothetical protein